MTQQNQLSDHLAAPVDLHAAIPPNVYWAPLADNFYDADGKGQGNDFYRQWHPRRAEFPQGESWGWGPGSAHNPFKAARHAAAELALSNQSGGPIEQESASPQADECTVTREDANNYCEILRALGMEEEGDPVAAVKRLVAFEDGVLESAALATASPATPTQALTDEQIAGMLPHRRHRPGMNGATLYAFGDVLHVARAVLASSRQAEQQPVAELHMPSESEMLVIARDIGDEDKHCMVFNKDGAFSIHSYGREVVREFCRINAGRSIPPATPATKETTK